MSYIWYCVIFTQYYISINLLPCQAHALETVYHFALEIVQQFFKKLFESELASQPLSCYIYRRSQRAHKIEQCAGYPRISTLTNLI